MTRDIHAEITETIISKLETGALPWRKDWQDAGNGTPSMPRRANGEFYKGINVLLLWMTALEKGFSADQWMTFKQAKTAGGAVRKGERGTKIVFYKTLELEDENGEERKVPMARFYTVFNVQQIDGLPEDLRPDLFDSADDIDTGTRCDADLDAFFSATGAQILIDGSQPRYNTVTDCIHMPSAKQFESAAGYYGTLAHELTHWTGAKRRLDRFTNTVGKADYAFEELVAELGACFLTAAIGGAPDYDNSAAYIGSWLRALRDDKKFIFKAAAAAQRAVDFIQDAAAKGQGGKIAA